MIPSAVVRVRNYDPSFQAADSEWHLKYLSFLLFPCVTYFFLKQESGLKDVQPKGISSMYIFLKLFFKLFTVLLLTLVTLLYAGIFSTDDFTYGF